ncbi:MAG: hypothetical protein OEX01_01890 [Candidatus Bathyarchaeota archaeon]|nr:hypothetical protein [Candidatus Bathyarchaeota archaeon]
MSIKALAGKFDRKPKTIENKLRHLGLNVAASKLELSGELYIPQELHSLEEILKILAGAIKKACKASLGRNKLQRPRTASRRYHNLARAKYV